MIQRSPIQVTITFSHSQTIYCWACLFRAILYKVSFSVERFNQIFVCWTKGEKCFSAYRMRGNAGEKFAPPPALTIHRSPIISGSDTDMRVQNKDCHASNNSPLSLDLLPSAVVGINSSQVFWASSFLTKYVKISALHFSLDWLIHWLQDLVLRQSGW